jgi:hypothetical protein
MNDHGDEMDHPKKIQYICRNCAYIVTVCPENSLLFLF